MTRYMISYAELTADGLQFNRCEMAFRRPIRSMAEVDGIAADLRDQLGLTHFEVLGFSRFDDEAGNREAR